MSLEGKAQKNLEKIKEYYDDLLENIEEAANTSDRAYGGYIRAFKGELVEYIARELVRITWEDVLDQDIKRLEINKTKMPVKLSDKYNYIDKIESPVVKGHILENRNDYVYKFGTDEQVFIDGKLVIPIECKAYTENAMMKRILFDAELMKELTGCDTYYLLQLESQLGGDYSELNDITYGSKPTHVLMSHSDVNLKIMTLLKGERKVDRPIHKPEFFKELKIEQLEKVVMEFKQVLSKYVK